MAVAGVIATLDGAFGGSAVLTSLLAIPPVIAATRASLPETTVVAFVCFVLTVLSGLWNDNMGSVSYVIEILTVTAGSIAGLWVASLRVDLTREQDAAELLSDAGALLEDKLDRVERAEHLVDLCVPVLGEVAFVDMIDPEGTIVRIASKSEPPKIAEVFDRLRAELPIDRRSSHPVAEAIRSGETVEVGALTEQQIEELARNDEEENALREHRFQRALVLPLKARGSILGTLTMWIMRPTNSFGETARRTATRLAERAAFGLDNARLHEQQAHIAGVLQGSLLPRTLPEIQGFEVASRFLAAGEAYEVGGDFYDAFRTGSRSWSIVIGDVCGKGPEAAALTSMARYTVRTASDPRKGPSAVLRVLHDSIKADRSDLRFCTAALLRIDPPSNGSGAARLTVSLGGHPPPLALRRNGDVEPVGDAGSLLGALPDPKLRDTADELGPGESLILYTDGLLDARNRKRGDEQTWLAGQASKLAGKPPDEVAKKLTAAAVRRHGGEPRDDIAVIVLRRS